MNYSKVRNSMWFLMMGALLLGIANSRGAEFWLRAGTNTVTMPDGRSVVMWGFALDASARAVNAPITNGLITTPGPELSIPVGDSLIIHLVNTLPEPVSIVIPGQYNFDSMDPTFHTDGAYQGRLRSLTREAAPNGGTATYIWTNVQAGTFLYHSGSHPSVQVQMGLYGALSVTAPGPQVYAGVPFDYSATLLFSEIDPEVHDAVGAGQFGPGPLFLPADFPNPVPLINSLSSAAAGTVAAFVWSQIPAEDQAILTDPQQTLETRTATLVRALNTILNGPCIYDPNLFPDSNLSAATLALLKSAPSINYPQSGVPFNGNVARLNRLLMQDGLGTAGIALQPVNKMTSTIRSYPQYFLVNGQPYTSSSLPIPAGSAGSTILLRLLNAGMDAHVPTLNNGGDIQLLSEDGQPLPYPRNSSVVFMPALKTIDALWIPPSLGNFAVYDRRLGVVNGTQSPGGMLAYLAVGNVGTLTGPRILVPPANQSVFVGGSATFNVVATHRGTLSYQWQKDATDIPGATNSTFAILSVTNTDAGNYRVIVTDTVDTESASTTSSSASLDVYDLPIFTTPPTNQIVFAGTAATFSVLITNGGTLTYQWRKDEGAIAGATGSAYTIASAGLTNAGSYQVVVTDTVGISSLTVTSPPALLGVVTQPNPVTVMNGGLATFSVTDAGGATLNYQWRRDGTTIDGATNSSYSFTADYLTDNGHNYSVVVNGFGTQITSADALLTVNLVPPTITTPPVSQTIFAGSSVTFSVTATNVGTLSYQWQKEGSPITGATNSSYTIASASLTNAGSYLVVVTDNVGTGSVSTTSSAASLSVMSQPNAVTAVDGGLATFSVTVASSAVLDYQWQRDGVAIGSATNSSYTFTANYLTDNGHNYSLVVTGPGGPVTSANALLTVTPRPLAITTQPANQTVPDFGIATFTVTARGTAMTYQWQRRSGSSFGSIAGATASSYSFNVRRPADNGAVFRVVVSALPNQQITSANAVLTVTPVGPQIVTQPVNVTVNAGQPTNLTIVAQATGPLSYQWQKRNGGNNWVNVNVTPNGGVSGATTPTLSFNASATSNPANAGSYRVRVTSTGQGAGSVTSDIATLTLKAAPPAITAPPVSQTILAGSSVTFRVTAAGSEPLAYQWQKDGIDLPGATARNSMLKIGSANEVGNYTVVITNPMGSVTSAPVALNVQKVFTVKIPAGIDIQIPANGGTGGTVANGTIAGGSASQYPSRITIPAMNGRIQAVTVTLKGLWHPRPNDIQALLVSPGGSNARSVLFMSGVGPAGVNSDSSRVINLTLNFDDDAQSSAPTAKLTSGTYKPTQNKPVSEFPAGSSTTPPGKAGFGTAMSNFINLSPCGDWLLYIVDDSVGPTKRAINGGVLTPIEQRGIIDSWSLTVTVGPQAVNP